MVYKRPGAELKLYCRRRMFLINQKTISAPIVEPTEGLVNIHPRNIAVRQPNQAADSDEPPGENVSADNYRSQHLRNTHNAMRSH